MNDITVYMIIFMIVQTLVVGYLIYNIEENAKNRIADIHMDLANLKLFHNKLCGSVIDIQDKMDAEHITPEHIKEIIDWIDQMKEDEQAAQQAKDMEKASDEAYSNFDDMSMQDTTTREYKEEVKEFDTNKAQGEALKKARAKKDDDKGDLH